MKASGEATAMRADEVTGRYGDRVGRLACSILAGAALAACGAGSGSGGASGPATPTPATTAPATPPPGGPAPPQLIGSWTDPNAAPLVAPVVLTLTSSRYTIRTSTGEGSGAIVVNGDEIDFFSSPRCAELPLPMGVGRYHWTVQGTTLHLSPLNADPCGRVDYLPDKSFTRSN
jgi:hypothetical protein